MSNMFMHEQIYRDLAPASERLVDHLRRRALGANLAETLARMGLRRLRVIDRDSIEAQNLSTQPWQTQDVGAPKVRVLANMLHRAVGARVESRHLELTDANAAQLFKGSAVVVDAFDNIAARQAVIQATHAAGIPCLHIALGGDGDYGCALWDDRYQLPSGIGAPDRCDYALTRPLALLVAAAGAEVLVTFFLEDRRQEFDLTLRDLHLSLATPPSAANGDIEGGSAG